MWCLKICIGSCLDAIRHQWRPTPMCIHLENLLSNWEKLWIYDQELLAIIWALEEWRYYIQGSPHTMMVLSDHKNLTYYWDARKLNCRQAWWSLFLSEFDIKLVHISRTKMVQSDALSWWPDFTPENDNDNEDITMLPENLFIHLIDTDLQNRIAECEDMDKDTTDALITLLDQISTLLRTGLEDWTTEKFGDKNVLFFKGKNYIPKDETLRRDIAKMFHDHETTGHPGELETYNTIRQHYWWPGLCTFVKNYDRDVVYASSSKLTDTLQNWHFYLRKGQNRQDPLPIAPWISSQTFHYQKDLTPSWLWSIKVLVRG